MQKIESLLFICISRGSGPYLFAPFAPFLKKKWSVEKKFFTADSAFISRESHTLTIIFFC